MIPCRIRTLDSAFSREVSLADSGLMYALSTERYAGEGGTTELTWRHSSALSASHTAESQGSESFSSAAFMQRD
jgi:hypothetical protein